MVRILKILAVIALTAVLVVGLTTTVCCNGNPNGDVPNGDVSNGDGANGDVPNGDVPNGDETVAEPDLTSGLGSIIDCEEYSGPGLQAGDPAPDFTFQDAAGTTFSLSDFKGKQVMLNFWATWCGPCQGEIPFIQQVYEEWQGEEVVILTIDVGENAETVSSHLSQNGISLPVLLDTERIASTQYGIFSIPRSFFIDEEGAFQGMLPGALQSAQELEDILNWLISL